MDRIKITTPCDIRPLNRGYCKVINGGCITCKEKRLEAIISGSKEKGMCYTGDILEVTLK